MHEWTDPLPAAIALPAKPLADVTRDRIRLQSAASLCLVLRLAVGLGTVRAGTELVSAIAIITPSPARKSLVSL